MQRDLRSCVLGGGRGWLNLIQKPFWIPEATKMGRQGLSSCPLSWGISDKYNSERQECLYKAVIHTFVKKEKKSPFAMTNTKCENHMPTRVPCICCCFRPHHSEHRQVSLGDVSVQRWRHEEIHLGAVHTWGKPRVPEQGLQAAPHSGLDEHQWENSIRLVLMC